MRKLAEFIVNKRWLFFILFAALIVYCAFCIPRVEVEYDITTYLPEDTDTKQALDIMAKEFDSYGTATLLIKNISFDDATELHDEIAGLDGVRMFTFSEDNYKDNCAKFSITFAAASKDNEAKNAFDKTVKI
ncbi:MAG: RND transporter, partial [Clostridiales bacterium]|nr:RND transporter [Clostridiales bacterium]